MKLKRKKLENKNFSNAEKRANTAIQSFLRKAGASEEYHLFKEKELNDWLSKFWFGAHTKDKENPDFCTVNSLKSFKYGLKRHLKMGHEYDITKSLSILTAMDNFDIACKKFKEHSKGVVKNHLDIEEEGKYSKFSTIFCL